MATQTTLQTSFASTPTSDAVFTAKANPPRPSALSAVATFTWRAMLKIKHVPMQLFDVTVFPVILTLTFTYLFGGALGGSIEQYLYDFLPGILVMIITTISMYTALALNTDISKGIFDRFRALPFWRPAIIVGALFGDGVRYLVAAVVMVLLGLIIGFRPQAGVIGVIGAVATTLIFAFSLSWVWTIFGLLMKTPESVMGVTGMIVFPLSFASNIFVDISTMPSWLQTLVNLNPITHATTVSRGLMHGTLTVDQFAVMLLSCVILIAVFAPISMYLFYNKGKG